MEEAFNYWQEKSRQNQYWNHGANEKGILAKTRAAEIKEELSKNDKIVFCSDKCDLCPSNNKSPVPTSPKTGETNKKSNNKNNQISDSEKSQLLNYFLKHGVKKISFKNGKLIIEYNNNTTKVTEENKDQQLQKYRQLIKTLPSQSLSLSDLQENNTNNPSTPNKNNTGIYISLAIGAFILGGIFVYFLARKKKK